MIQQTLSLLLFPRKSLPYDKLLGLPRFSILLLRLGSGLLLQVQLVKSFILILLQLDLIPFIILGGLIGAISWNIITWYLGLPTSSSHALIGGIMGSGISAAGFAVIKYETVELAAIFMFVSPIDWTYLWVSSSWLLFSGYVEEASKSKVDRYFKRLQLFSAGIYSFSHGTNDAQKTMGIITPLLFSIGYFGASVDPNNLPVPFWVILSAHAAIALGTLAGGWRIVKTMGHRITKLRPVHGFAAETAGAATILGASIAGIPVSTTHVICSSIMGVGATKRLSAVRWGIARNIVWVWILTIPISALLGFVAFKIINFLYRTIFSKPV